MSRPRLISSMPKPLDEEGRAPPPGSVLFLAARRLAGRTR